MTHVLGKKIDPVVLDTCNSALWAAYDTYKKAVSAVREECMQKRRHAWLVYDKPIYATDGRRKKYEEAANEADDKYIKQRAAIMTEYNKECSAASDALLVAVSNDPVASWIVTNYFFSAPYETIEVLRMLPTTLEATTLVAIEENWCHWDERVESARLAGILDGESPA